MADSTFRSDSVNVEQVMEQIRARIRDKRGVDYSEQQIQELANARLEKLLAGHGSTPEALAAFQKLQPKYEPPALPSFEFEDTTLFDSTRGLLRTVRRLLQPILKLFFNPNPLIRALNIQSRLNAIDAEREHEREVLHRASEQLYYTLLHDVVVESTRTSLELKNLRMRLESIDTRLEFNERRARTLEGAVLYKSSDSGGQRGAPRQQQQQSQPQPPRPSPPPQPAPIAASPAASPPPAAGAQQPGDAGGHRRKRRRRRGRRGGGAPGQPPMGGPVVTPAAELPPPARDNLENLGGAEAHRSEPMQADAPAEREPHEPTPPAGPADDAQ